MAKEQQYRIYRDYSIDAEVNSDGVLEVLEGRAALENAIRQWVSSFRGEYIRNPRKGGYITYWLLKPMNEETRRSIVESIREGFYEDFYPAMEIRTLDVTPNYEGMFWEIHLEGYSPSVKIAVNIHEKLRALR